MDNLGLKLSIIAIITIFLSGTYGSTDKVRRCFSCRSRGVLGDCKDPFYLNSTHLVSGVKAVPCASGWCAKRIEGDKHGENFELATERSCLQRPPQDLKERCGDAFIEHKKLFLCVCYGSLCNSSIRTPILSIGIVWFIGLLTYFRTFLLL